MEGRLRQILVVAGYESTSILTHEGRTKVSLREARRLDQFADALAAETMARVAVVDGFQLPDDLTGTALVGHHTFLHWLEEEADPTRRILPRVVWLDTHRAVALPALEGDRLAAAVDIGTYAAWQSRPNGPGRASLYGLKALAEQLDATCFDEGDRYCLMTSTRHESLPALLVAYLAIYLPLIERPP